MKSLLKVTSCYRRCEIKMSLDVNISEPDEFNCIELHDCIKSVTKIYNIEEFNYHVDVLCGKGQNYIANVFRVNINDINSNNSVSVIVKTLINTTRQELFSELHKREVYAYRNVINKFVIFQNDIEIRKRILLPKYIFAETENNKEVIILEDLLMNGFLLDNKFAKHEKLDYDRVCLIISELAKFHALSFVFKNKEPDSFQALQENFGDLIYQNSFLNKTKLINYFQESFEISVNLINDKEVKRKLDKVNDKLLDLLRMYTKPKELNVFCHGDCWINNILFKDEAGRKQLCFLDFQAMRYANPVTDVLYFLYLCTDSAFRSEYAEKVKMVYYNSLANFLKLFEIDERIVYPKDIFENDMKEMLPFGLLVALIELRVIATCHEDNVNDLTVETGDIKYLLDNGNRNVYKIRVNDVIEESVNSGVLDKLLDVVSLL